MTVKLDPAARASDLGEYAKALDEGLARPAEQASLGVSGKSPAAPPGVPALDPDALVPLVEIVGAIATDRTGTARLTESESQSVADALAPVLDKYADDFFERYSEEIALAAVVSIVAWPRVREAQRSKPKAVAKAAEDSAELSEGKAEGGSE